MTGDTPTTTPQLRRVLLAVAAGYYFACPAEALTVERLTPPEVETLHATLQALEPSITAKKQDGTANLLTWEELYAPLSPDRRAFLDAFRALKAEMLGATTHYFGEAPPADLVPVGSQQTLKNGTPTPLDPQYLPRPVYEAYLRMMDIVEQVQGRKR